MNINIFDLPINATVQIFDQTKLLLWEKFLPISFKKMQLKSKLLIEFWSTLN